MINFLQSNNESLISNNKVDYIITEDVWNAVIKKIFKYNDKKNISVGFLFGFVDKLW